MSFIASIAPPGCRSSCTAVSCCLKTYALRCRSHTVAAVAGLRVPACLTASQVCPQRPASSTTQRSQWRSRRLLLLPCSGSVRWQQWQQRRSWSSSTRRLAAMVPAAVPAVAWMWRAASLWMEPCGLSRRGLRCEEGLCLVPNLVLCAAAAQLQHMDNVASSCKCPG